MSNIMICDGCGNQINPYADNYWHCELNCNTTSMLTYLTRNDLCNKCFRKAMTYLKKEIKTDDDIG